MPSHSVVQAALASLSARLPAAPTIVCLGGTSGIGEAIARKFTSLAEKPNVHLVGRSEAAANKIIADLRAEKPAGSYHFHAGDLTLASELKRLIQDVRQQVERIDYLVLSCGILTLAGRTETKEGNDRKLMLHYYARMGFVNGLQDKLHPGSRVLSVLDSTRGNPSKLIWDDLDLKTHYSSSAAMTHAVTMTDVAFEYFAAKYPEVVYMHAYPGIVKTPLFRDLPWYARMGASAISTLVAIPPEECADYMLHAFLAEDVKPYRTGGACFADSKGNPVKNKTPASEDEKEKVWNHTLQIVQ